MKNFRAFNVKMLDMARANADVAFDFARQIATAKTLSDIIELWPAHARKQFEMLSEQSKELTALGQKMAAESAAPIARSVNQVFKIASWGTRAPERKSQGKSAMAFASIAAFARGAQAPDSW